MKKMLKRFAGATLVLLIVVYLIGMLYESQAEARDRTRFAPLGKLVDVDGRQAHLYCTGENQSGSPTVILEAGGGDHLYTWYTLQREISRFTRVCSYDRAGIGWSEAAAGRRTAGQIADELSVLLQTALEPGPYVMVGHSYGGLIARIFAARHPQDVAGLVLIDSTNAEDIVTYAPLLLKIVPSDVGLASLIQKAGGLRLFGVAPSLLSESFAFLPADVIPAAQALSLRAGSFWVAYREMMLMPESAREAVQAGTLGDMPVIVFATSAEEDDSFPENYLEHFRALSTHSQVSAVDCGHYVHLERPELVLDAIRALVEAEG